MLIIASKQRKRLMKAQRAEECKLVEEMHILQEMKSFTMEMADQSSDS